MQKHWKGVRGLKCYIYKNLLAWHYILSTIVDHNKHFINKNLCPYFKISWSKTLSHLSKIYSLFISGNATKIEHCLKSIRIRSFLARIFTHSDWIQRDTKYVSPISPNAGKCGPEKLRIRKLFTQWKSLKIIFRCLQHTLMTLGNIFLRLMCHKKPEYSTYINTSVCWVYHGVIVF